MEFAGLDGSEGWTQSLMKSESGWFPSESELLRDSPSRIAPEDGARHASQSRDFP